MKLSLLVLLIACPWAIQAQTSADQTIARLKSEIARREAIDRDSNTPDSLKAMNRRMLDQRRAELIDAIQAKVNAVQKYLETLGPAATEEEKQTAAKSLREAANNTNGVYDSKRTAGQSGREQPASTDLANVAPSFVNTKAETGATDISTDDAPFEITSPPDALSTGVSEIEVTVKLKSGLALGFDIVFKVVVKDKDGKEIDKQDLKIEGTKTFAKSDPLNLAEGDNTIEVTQAGKKLLRKVIYKPAGKRAAGPSPETDPKGIKIAGAKSIQADKREAKIKVEAEKKEGDPAEKTIVIEVTNDNKEVEKTEKTFPTADLAKGVDLNVKIRKGVNKVIVSDKNKKTDRDSAEITCNENCSTADGGLISINSPAPGETFPTSFYQASLTVDKAPTNPIQKLKYYVLRDGVSVVKPDDVEAVEVKYKDNEPAKIVIPIKFVEGRNEVTFFDPEHKDDNKYKASVVVNCEGPKCAKDFLVSTIATNSMNTRAIVGMEQAGASSASSETKPFLDFFFTNGILFDTLKRQARETNGNLKTANGKPVMEDVLDRDGKPIKVPRFGTWGQVRFSTTPQQTASASVFPSNFVNQVTDPTKVVDMVQSFDFLGGIEVRAASANGWNWTLIPGVRQKSRFFVTFGAGAISPLNAARTSAQIFKIPATTSPQRTDFVDRFGEPPTGKTYVGFVPLERDRFFRQYYVGIRFKSHYCDDDDCTRFRNSFPSVVDFGFGQNEAVTGGELKQNGKRSWVLRLDTFYPLPFRDLNFLYLYGTAMMKIGQGGVRIDNPLFLDTAPGDVQITSTDVFIPPASLQPSRLNRDYYKIGIGINLTDLFNRNKTPPQ